MNRKTERLIIRGYWILAFVFMFVGIYFLWWSGQGIWLIGGGFGMFLYLVFVDIRTSRQLMDKDNLDKSIGELEEIIDEIEKEGWDAGATPK